MPGLLPDEQERLQAEEARRKEEAEGKIVDNAHMRVEFACFFRRDLCLDRRIVAIEASGQHNDGEWTIKVVIFLIGC